MTYFTKNFTLAVLATLFFASCSTDQAVFAPTESFTERIDMVLQEDGKDFIYQKNAGDAGQLVGFNTYGNPSQKVDMHINLGDGRTLVFKLTDNINWNPWEQEGGFSMFVTRELEDKSRFVTAELQNGGETATHQSNDGDVFPRSTYVNVFKILDFNPANNEIFCRIIDLPMINQSNGKIMTISGTFRGTVGGSH